MEINKIAKSLKIVKLPVDLVQADELQPRRNFNQRDIDILAKDIEERGQLDPILVTETGDGRYTIVGGERRWRAHKQIGLKKIEAIIASFSEPVEFYEAQFVSNGLHKNPSIQDMAQAVERYVEECKRINPEITQREIANRLSEKTGYSTTYFQAVKAILDIEDPEFRAMVDDKRIGGYFPKEVKSATNDEDLQKGLISGMKTIVKGGKKTTALIPRYIKHKINDSDTLNLDPQEKQRLARNEILQVTGYASGNIKGDFLDYSITVKEFGGEVEDMVMNGLTEDEALELSSMIHNIADMFDSKRKTHFGRLNGGRK